MATIQMQANLQKVESYYYDPDGPNSPLTLQFPLASSGNNGSRIRIVNKTDSDTPITLLASGSDTIADPTNPSVFASSVQVGYPLLCTQYQCAGSQWRLLTHGNPALPSQALSIFSFAGYGGLRLSAPLTQNITIDDTWQLVSVFDTDLYTTPRGVVQNVANSSLKFTHAGVYQLSVLLNYVHTESQQSRSTGIRLYNTTDGVVMLNPITIPISRNQPATLISLSTVVEVSEAYEGKEMVIQIGGGDDIDVTEIHTALWSVFAISEWRGPITESGG